MGGGVTRDWVVGNGCRSLGLGSLGIRSSGSTLTCGRTERCYGRPRRVRGQGSGVSYPHLPLAGAQIQVQAALEPLVDEATVGRDLAQAGELPG